MLDRMVIQFSGPARKKKAHNNYVARTQAGIKTGGGPSHGYTSAAAPTKKARYVRSVRHDFGCQSYTYRRARPRLLFVSLLNV